MNPMAMAYQQARRAMQSERLLSKYFLGLIWHRKHQIPKFHSLRGGKGK
jgi:hypothetical protein